MITHSNLSRIIVYLRGLYSGRINSLREYQMLNRCSRVDRNIVEEFCDKCCLTRLTHNANDILTAKGRNIIELCINDNGVEQFFRHLLKEYIREVKPGWAYKIPSGRAESLAAMTDDEKFCFFEAGLMRDPASLDDVKWWDDVASYFRPSDEDFLLRIGRRGEYLTMQYELERTNCSPRWISIESNYAGFDILSRNDARSTDKRLIEVKSTERFENEEFIIIMSIINFITLKGRIK